MSTAEMVLGPIGGVEGRRISPAAAFWNLFLKEIRESRSVLIIGVFTFWLVPVFLVLIAHVVTRNEGLQVSATLAYVLLLSSGWLFAAALGLNIVCRDFGRPEEHFLLAQPVTPRLAVAAKLLAAVVLVGLILGVLLVATHLLLLVGVDARRREDLSFPEALVLCLTGVSLVLSFSIAVITRQTTASLVLTMLIVALGITAPLVSTHFSFIHPNWELLDDLARKGDEGHDASAVLWWRVFGSFLVCVVVCVVGSLTAAFALCTRERTIRIGHKPLAWTVALAALLLFGAGMMEVGQSADICDRVRLWNQTSPGHSVLRCEKNRGYAVGVWGGSAANHLQVADFSIGPDGRLGAVRSNELSLAAIALSSEPGAQVLPAPRWIEEVTRIDKDRFTITGAVFDKRLLGHSGLSRIEVSWEKNGGFRPVATAIAGEAVDRPGAESEWGVYSKISTDRYAYLLYEEDLKNDPDVPGEEDQAGKPKRLILRVYDWSATPRAAKVLETAVPLRCVLRCTDSQVVFRDARSPFLVGAVPLDDIQAIKDLFARDLPQPRPLSREEEERLSRSRSRSRGHWDSELVLRQDNVSYEVREADTGLVAEQIGGPRLSETVRAYRYSPLSRLLSFGGGGLETLDSTLLAQQSIRAVIFYDVSDLYRIRRVGFHNTLVDWGGRIETADGHVLVLEGGDLTVLKRPQTARAGVAAFAEEAPTAGAAAGS